jgi:hypothetical protein
VKNIEFEDEDQDLLIRTLEDWIDGKQIEASKWADLIIKRRDEIDRSKSMHEKDGLLELIKIYNQNIEALREKIAKVKKLLNRI